MKKFGMAIAVGATSVFWTEAAYLQGGAVKRVSTGGGAVETIATTSQNSSGLTVDASFIYWAAPGGLMKRALGGGATTNFVPRAPEWSWLGHDATNLYWSDRSTGSHYVTALAGGGSFLIAGGEPSSPTIATDATRIYWTDKNRIQAAALSSGPIGPTETLFTSTTEIRDIAIDATNLYWLRLGTPRASLVTMPIAGGTPTTLATGVFASGRVTTDGNYVYWLGDGNVMRIRK